MMKVTITAASKKSKKVTSQDLVDLFRNLDWDDVDWADRYVDRFLIKALNLDPNKHIFSQASYINQLDENSKNELMSWLSDPEAVHSTRMKGRRKSSSKKSGNSYSIAVRYEEYPDGGVRSATFKGADLRDALKNMVSSLGFYLDENQIEDDDMSAEDIIEELESRNGDGCDFIITLKDKSTGQMLMDYQDSFEEEDF